MKLRTILFVTVVGWTSVRVHGDHVFMIKETESKLTIEKTPIPTDREVTFSCNAQSGIVDVVFPVGPGGSGSLSRLSDDRDITVSHEAGGISVLERGRNGKEWRRPTRSLDDLHHYDIRVSVISHEGARRAFLIRGYEEVNEGPVNLVVDLFAGKIPTGPGDYIIHTETYGSKIDHPVTGVAPLEYDRYLYLRARLPGAEEGVFVVDLGAGQTVVARSFLPADAAIEKLGVAQYSSAGKEVLKYAPDGATGSTEVLGGVTLTSLAFGDLVLANADVAVMASLPELGGRHVDGILGLDLLRRAPFLTLEFGEHPSIHMSSKTESAPSESFSVPFALINSHIVVTSHFNNAPVVTILDTGAPTCLLDAAAAGAAGLKPDTGEQKDARGLGGQSIRIYPAKAHSFRIGDRMFSDVALMISPLPIFAPLRVHGQSIGLLGNSTLSKLNRLEIDFGTNTIRFANK